MHPDAHHSAACDFHERCDSILAEFVASFRAHGRKRSRWLISWQPVDGDTLSRIWLVYGKRGTIFDSEGLNRIADRILALIARLHVANEISGHSQHDSRPEAEEYLGREFTGKQWDRFVGGMETREGAWFVSDYGLPALEALFLKLHGAATDEDQLLIIDRVLNVVHQRGDLAAMFVTGGTDTLNKISEQGGYTTLFVDYSDRVRQQHEYCA